MITTLGGRSQEVKARRGRSSTAARRVVTEPVGQDQIWSMVTGEIESHPALHRRERGGAARLCGIVGLRRAPRDPA